MIIFKDAPFHYTAFDYLPEGWNGFCGHIRYMHLIFVLLMLLKCVSHFFHLHQQNRSIAPIAKLKLANCHYSWDLISAIREHANKTRTPINSQKVGSTDFW